MTIKVIGYASDLGANTRGAALGSSVLENDERFHPLPLEWLTHIKATDLTGTTLERIAGACTTLAELTYRTVRSESPFIVFGGDHSAAIGTWSGVAAAIDVPLGLVWIDAHMDAHTPETSPTQNIHGMPVACLMGAGYPSLTQILTNTPKLKPNHIVMIGIRSFESGEAAFLKQHGVTVYDINDVTKHGLPCLMDRAYSQLQRAGCQIGLSLDIDAIDPTDVPGVSTPVPNGISLTSLQAGLDQLLSKTTLIGCEIVEFNPTKDASEKTISAIAALTKQLMPSLKNNTKTPNNK